MRILIYASVVVCGFVLPDTGKAKRSHTSASEAGLCRLCATLWPNTETAMHLNSKM